MTAFDVIYLPLFTVSGEPTTFSTTATFAGALEEVVTHAQDSGGVLEPLVAIPPSLARFGVAQAWQVRFNGERTELIGIKTHVQTAPLPQIPTTLKVAVPQGEYTTAQIIDMLKAVR